MKTPKWDNFTSQISDDQMKEIIREYEQLCDVGHIGDCLLRQKAEDWGKIIGSENITILFMNDLAFSAYKRFAEKYFEYQKSLRGWDGSE